jgi:hypothetical protein
MLLTTNCFIRRLETSNSEEFLSPSWSQVESAVRTLDGAKHSLIVLGIGDPAQHANQNPEDQNDQ